MPVFINADGTRAYPTHRCTRCQNLLLRAPGLVCDECLRHAPKHPDIQRCERCLSHSRGALTVCPYCQTQYV
jgi:predicted amidophosphoribosyltransferase